MSAPARDRPTMPDGYGVPPDAEGLLAWPDVEPRLVAALVYWLATTRPDGRPHVVPRWGVWSGGAFFYDGSPQTRHAQNLRTNGACALHLEDGTRAVVVEGTSGPAAPPGPELGARLAAGFAKYHALGYEPAADAWEGEDAGGLCRFAPSKALAWTSFPTDVTRFRWPSERGSVADVDGSYAAYDEHPLDEPDEWGDLASFRQAASVSET